MMPLVIHLYERLTEQQKKEVSGVLLHGSGVNKENAPAVATDLNRPHKILSKVCILVATSAVQYSQGSVTVQSLFHFTGPVPTIPLQ